MTSVLKVDNIQNSSGTSAITIDSSGQVSLNKPLNGAVSVALIADEKTVGTDGGTFTSGAWRTRDLNTEIFDPDGIVSISSNQFTLGAGTYLLQVKSTAYRVGKNRVRVYNVTDSINEGLSNSAFEDADNDGNSLVEATVLVTPISSKIYEIQHFCQLTNASNGFGVNTNLAGNEIYTTVFITKLK
jgi:hypothetical protein